MQNASIHRSTDASCKSECKNKKNPECEICTKLFSTTSGFLNLSFLNCENKMSEFGDKSTRYIVKL